MEARKKMTSLRELFFSFLKLGLGAFGGPAMIAYIEDLAVTKKNWLDKKSFREGVAIAQVIPGATAMQVAAYVGWKARNTLGALVSYTAFVLPAFIFMFLLSIIYQKTHTFPQFISIFTGLRIAIVAIVGGAFLNFFLPIAKKPKEVFIAFLSFLLFLYGVNPFLIILTCFIFSLFLFQDKSLPSSKPSQLNLKTVFFFIGFIFLFLLVLYFWDKLLFTLSLTMMKIDLFAFGGGYTSLPLMLHEVVDNLKWLDKKTFMDGIALGQVTPGPIVITATFVGYFVKKFLGSIVATISIFTPSFTMIAIATKLQERIKYSGIFLRVKRGLLASFSGLLLFADIKFAQAVSWDFIKLSLCVIAFIALIKRINILYVILGVIVFSLLIL